TVAWHAGFPEGSSGNGTPGTTKSVIVAVSHGQRCSLGPAHQVDDVLMTDWTGRTATEIAAAVRAGETTAGQVVARHLDRIAKLNGELGAFIRVRAAEAASEADAVGKRADLAELPLAGVPGGGKEAGPGRGRA